MTAATKNASLRHNEYYGMQERLDELYQQSLTDKKFKKLYEEIIAEKNILLAYRNIKANTGSKTKGTDNLIINDIAKMTNERVVATVRNRLAKYKPQSVRRVEIPKPNGKLRPLGIPTISDRLIQQCILQILDPICEAKFHNHSYGFRPNRNTEHAIAMMYKMINQWPVARTRSQCATPRRSINTLPKVECTFTGALRKYHRTNSSIWQAILSPKEALSITTTGFLYFLLKEENVESLKSG